MSVIPETYEEVERIYDLTFGSGHKSVVVASVNPKEGKTSLALALAQRNLLAGQSTLIVDFNAYNPEFKPVFPKEDGAFVEPDHDKENSSTHEFQNAGSPERQLLLAEPELITTDNTVLALTGVVFPKGNKNIMLLRNPGVMESYIERWLTSFDAVVFDTTPIKNVNAQNIPVKNILKASDIGVMVVLTNHTKEHELVENLNKLGSAKDKIKGIVLNDQYNPSLRDELLRQIDKLSNRLGWVKRTLSRFVVKRQFLSNSDN